MFGRIKKGMGQRSDLFYRKHCLLFIGLAWSLASAPSAPAGVPGPDEPNYDTPFAVIAPGTDDTPPHIEKDGARADDHLLFAIDLWEIAGRRKYGVLSSQYANRLLQVAKLTLGGAGDGSVAQYKEVMEILLLSKSSNTDQVCETAHMSNCTIYFTLGRNTRTQK